MLSSQVNYFHKPKITYFPQISHSTPSILRPLRMLSASVQMAHPSTCQLSAPSHHHSWQDPEILVPCLQPRENNPLISKTVACFRFRGADPHLKRFTPAFKPPLCTEGARAQWSQQGYIIDKKQRCRNPFSGWLIWFHIIFCHPIPYSFCHP